VSKKQNSVRKLKLELIAAEKLSTKIIDQIDRTEIEVWKEVEPGLQEINGPGNMDLPNPWIQIDIRDKYIWLRAIAKIPLSRFIAWISGIITLSLAFLKLLGWLFPILESYVSRGPPVP
jgi:hypothetical protein